MYIDLVGVRFRHCKKIYIYEAPAGYGLVAGDKVSLHGTKDIGTVACVFPWVSEGSLPIKFIRELEGDKDVPTKRVKAKAIFEPIKYPDI